MAGKISSRQSQVDIDDAKARGVFEGQVLSKLTSIETTVSTLNNSYTNLEARTRVLEQNTATFSDSLKNINQEFTHQVNIRVPQIIKDADDAHKRIWTAQDLQDARLKNLEKQDAEWAETAKNRTKVLDDFETRMRDVETAVIENKATDRIINAVIAIVASGIITAIINHFHF